MLTFPVTSLRKSFYVAALLATAVSTLHAQQQAAVPAQRATLPIVDVRLVQLDVVVTDKSGKAVKGLTAKDFQVFENGVQQKIHSFEPPTAHMLPPSAISAGLSADFNPANPENFGDSPVTVLIFDQMNTHFADTSFARRSLQQYLAGQPALLPQPTALLTLYDEHFKTLQTFTRDRDVLSKAIQAAPVKLAWKLETNGKTDLGPVERLDQSLRALEEIAESYAAIPGRKNLVWVGGGFPTIDPTVLDSEDATEVKNTLQHITDTLLNTHVTLYAVDPSSTAAGMTEITDTTQMEFMETAGDAFTVGSDPFGATADFDRLGPVTGGRIVRGRNDVAAQIASSIDLGANYYTLSYTPNSASDAPAKYRRIRIVCLRPGLTATTRDGYYVAPKENLSYAQAASYDLTAAAESPIPLHGLHITAEPDTAPSADAHTYILHVVASGLTWTPKPDNSSISSVYIMAVYLNANNKMLGHTLHGMTATAKPGVNTSNPSEIADFALAVQPRPKAATLRFIVRDNASGRMGSIDLPLAR